MEYSQVLVYVIFNYFTFFYFITGRNLKSLVAMDNLELLSDDELRRRLLQYGKFRNGIGSTGCNGHKI